MTLSDNDINRYGRNIALPEVGVAGQQRLMASTALVIGAGALGSVVSVYLAAAGIGHLVIADFDTVDISNLQRQVFYTAASVGRSKVSALCRHISELNPDVGLTVVSDPVGRNNITDLFEGADVVLECTDCAAVKHLVAPASCSAHVPCVIGGVGGWRGQVMSLNGAEDAYTAVFGNMPVGASAVSGGSVGVAGPVAGMVASVQAAEAMKILTGAGRPLYGRLLTLDALSGTVSTFEIDLKHP